MSPFLRSPHENVVTVEEGNMSDDSNCFNMNSNVYSQNVVEDDQLSNFSYRSRNSMRKNAYKDNLMSLPKKRKAEAPLDEN